MWKLIWTKCLKRVNNLTGSSSSDILTCVTNGRLKKTKKNNTKLSGRHEDQATETSQENHKFLQIQLQLQGTLSDPHRWDVLSGGFEKQDSDQRANAQIPDGGGAAVHNKVSTIADFTHRLISILNLPPITRRYCVLSCALKELETLGKELYGARIILQRFQARKCPHFKSPVPASECLLSMLEETNPHHYFVATQVNMMTHTHTYTHKIWHLQHTIGDQLNHKPLVAFVTV